MKKMKRFTYMLLLTAASTFGANAQTPNVSQHETPLFHQRLTTPSVDRDTQRWFKLEKDANLPAGTRYGEVRASDMQEIIFFASMYGEEIDFRASVSQLLDVYEHHADMQFRLLAAAALHAIGDPYGMEGLWEALEHESSPRVRHVTQAALRDFAKQSAKQSTQ